MSKQRLYRVISFFTCGILMIVFMFMEIDSLTWLFLIGMFVSLIILFVYSSDERKFMIDNYVKETDKYVLDNNVNVSKSVFSDTVSSRIIFDHDNKKLHILKYEISPVVIPYSKIVESELIEDGNTVTKTSRGSQLAGMAIGGSLAGGVGMIVGGLSSNTKSSKEVKKLEIKIIADDLYSPVSSFYVKDSINEFEKDSILYRNLYDLAYELHKTMSVIIKDNK